MRDEDKIIVVGAGPTGLSCAYWAAKNGLSVEVFEEKEELGEKPCGELIPKEALIYTPFNSDSTWIIDEINRCLIYYKNNFIRELKPKDHNFIAPVNGYIIDKKLFLRELKSIAVSNGARVHLKKTTYSDIQKKPNLIVDATGYRRSLGKEAGLCGNIDKIATCKMCYCTGNSHPHTAILNFFEKGYAWLFPRGDLINFGVGGFYGKRVLENLFRKNLRKFEIEPKNEDEIKTAPIILNGPADCLKKKNLVLAGESAGMVMPITGEGIRFALWSGSICFREDYEEIFWDKYGKSLKLGKKLLDLVLNLGEKRKMDLIREGSTQLLESIMQRKTLSSKILTEFPWLINYLDNFTSERLKFKSERSYA